MEHLVHDPDTRTLRAEVRATANTNFDISDWQEYDRYYGGCDPVHPRIPWLGHNHAASSYYHNEDEPRPMMEVFRDCYGKEWNLDQFLHTGEIKQAHASFQSTHKPEEVSVSQTAGFIQAWLYFGLLESIVAGPISVTYFVRADSDGRQWIYSRNLPVLLEAWMKGMRLLLGEDRDQKLSKARETASTAFTLFQDICKRFASNEQSTTMAYLFKLLVSIEPALTALFEGIIRWAEAHLGLEIQLVNKDIIAFPKPYLDRMIERGWCRFAMASAAIALPASLLRYVDAMNFLPSAEGHWQCTSQRCERNFIRRETYTQRHYPENCRCAFIKPDLAVVQDILECDFIPVVKLEEKNHTLELGGLNPVYLGEFIAFSHVWADGLGSSTETGLPTCQIQRLARLARHQLVTDSWFWIDGLCVPKQEPYRGKAIRLMKSTYQNAMGMVILDEGLRGLSIGDSPLKIGWSLFVSGWFSRLWTYQEGFLPRWVDIELGDGLINLSALLKSLHTMWKRRIGNQFPALYVRDLVSVLQKARPLATSAHHRASHKRLVDLFNALSRRDSSRPDDQLLVMGIMLGISVQTLLDSPTEDRWQTFYLELKQIPWTVIFDRRPRMTIPPFRWAPATWISAGQDEWLHYNDELADITPEGLKISLEVLLLDETRPTDFPTMLVSTSRYVYEIVRTDQAHIPGFATFNCVLVRHFINETPEFQLARNEAVYLRVGLGLIDLTGGTGLQYDCNEAFEILLLADESDNTDADTVEGSWQKVPLCFT